MRNRRRFLDEEISELTARLAERRTERARLGEEQAAAAPTRRRRRSGSTDVPPAGPRPRASGPGALRHRYDAAQTLESSSRQITAKRIELQQAVETDLDEREQQTREATLLFSRFAQALYGPR